MNQGQRSRTPLLPPLQSNFVLILANQLVRDCHVPGQVPLILSLLFPILFRRPRGLPSLPKPRALLRRLPLRLLPKSQAFLPLMA